MNEVGIDSESLKGKNIIDTIGWEVKETITVGKSSFDIVEGNDKTLYLVTGDPGKVLYGPDDLFEGVLKEEQENVLRTEIKTIHKTSVTLKITDKDNLPNFGLIVINGQIYYLYEDGTKERLKSAKGYSLRKFSE